MDDFLNTVRELSELAAKGRRPAFDAAAVMRSVRAAPPPARVVRFKTGFLAAAAASAAAASAAVALPAFAAWAEMNNPFLAIGNFADAARWLL